MAHKDIRIPFEIDGRRYEAVGFLEENEHHISGEEMFHRIGSVNIIGEEDVAFIKSNLHSIPTNLCTHLITNQRKPDSERSIRIFCCQGGAWMIFWNSLDRWYHAEEFVVRRLP